METKICTKVRNFAVDYGEGIAAVGLFVAIAGWLIKVISTMPYGIQSAIATVGIFIVFATVLGVLSFVAAESLSGYWNPYTGCGYVASNIAYWTTLVGGVIAPIAFVVYEGLILKPHDLIQILSLDVGFGLILVAVYGVFRRVVSGRWYAR